MINDLKMRAEERRGGSATDGAEQHRSIGRRFSIPDVLDKHANLRDLSKLTPTPAR
jgi:hypothetical protein